MLSTITFYFAIFIKYLEVNAINRDPKHHKSLTPTKTRLCGYVHISAFVHKTRL